MVKLGVGRYFLLAADGLYLLKHQHGDPIKLESCTYSFGLSSKSVEPVSIIRSYPEPEPTL